MGNIAIYGGSFDPPHKGHKLLAENLAKECNADKVIIIPAYSSPFKDGTVAEGTDRLAMCRHTFSSPLFEISAIGSIVPTSLLAYITEIKTVVSLIAFFTSSNETNPFSSTGR